MSCPGLYTAPSFGKSLGSFDKDVLPLPVEPDTPQEQRILKAMEAGTTLEDVCRDFSRSVRVAGRAAWIFLLVTALNYLALGLKAPQEPWPL